MKLDRRTLHDESTRVAAWLASRAVRTHTTQFETFDELLESAHVHRVALDACEGDLHAFVVLWQLYLEQIEELEIGAAHVDAFLRSFDAGVGYGNEAAFAPLSRSDWVAETSLVTSQIRAAIADVRNGRRRIDGTRVDVPAAAALDPNVAGGRWGVVDEGRRVADDRAFPFLAADYFVDGVAVRREWNAMELFAKSSVDYALFVWHTSA